MSEFDEKLNALLSNPDSMAQIMQLAQSLSGPGGAAQQQADSPQPPPPAQYQQSAQPQPQYQQPQQPQQQYQPPQYQQQAPFQAPPAGQSPPSSLGDLLSSFTGGGVDPKLLTRLLPLVKELNGPQDTQARQLLYALRPYLKTQRQEKVERALQLARLVHLGKKFLSGWEG